MTSDELHQIVVGGHKVQFSEIDRDLIPQVNPAAMKPLPYPNIRTRLPYLVEPDESNTSDSNSLKKYADKEVKIDE